MQVKLRLFDRALEDHWKLVEGDIIGVWKATIMPPVRLSRFLFYSMMMMMMMPFP